MNDTRTSRQDSKQARSTAFREQIIEKWQSDLEAIRTDVVTLYHGRSIYNRLFDIVEANPRIQVGNALYEWLHRCYALSTAMAIRRLLDEHKDAVSLAKLVESIQKNQHHLSRKWFVSQCMGMAEPVEEDKLLHPEEFLDWSDANVDFDKLAGAGRDTVDSEDLRRRLDELKSLSGLVMEYADKLVAHKDSKPPDKLPTYGGLDSAIDAVGDLFKYLDVLLTQGSFVRLEPGESFRWERLFEEPWIIEIGR